MEFPAEYMFKDVPEPPRPTARTRSTSRSARWTAAASRSAWSAPTASMPRGRCGSTPTGSSPASRSTRTTSPARCAGSARRRTSRTSRRSRSFPAGCSPQVPISDRRYYPIYQTCIDLDIPIIAQCRGPRAAGAGRVPARHALRPGLLRLPRAAHRDAPRRRAVGGPRRQAHAEVAGPPLHDERRSPRSTTRKAIIDYANTRGADKVMYAGYYPMGLSASSGSSSELPAVPLKDDVWPKFLRENAIRVFKLDGPVDHPALRRATGASSPARRRGIGAAVGRAPRRRRGRRGDRGPYPRVPRPPRRVTRTYR